MYLDLYLSTDPNNVAFFGNRSVVVHAANGTRLNCGNFSQMTPSETFGGTGNGSSGSNGSNVTAPGTTTPAHNSAADSLYSYSVMTASLAVMVVAGCML